MDDEMKLILLGLDAAIGGLIYSWYKQELKDAKAIQQAPSYVAQSVELYRALQEAPDNELPYVCVEGKVAAVGPLLHSQYTESRGVIQRLLVIEHKSRRVQGFWSDTTRNLLDVTNTTEFQIVSPAQAECSGPAVDPLEVLSAHYLNESLKTVYDFYDPAKDNFLSRSLDRFLFGEVTKGFQHTELMLHVGTPLIGIGRVVLSSDNSRIQLGPCGGARPYVITALTRREMVESVESRAYALKCFAMFFMGVGGYLAGCLLYKYMRRWLRNVEFTRRLAAVRQARSTGDPIDNDNNNALANPCVVCLVNRRDVIVLDCGHICLCASCCQVLPDPARCPVCRAPVNRFLPVYMS